MRLSRLVPLAIAALAIGGPSARSADLAKGTPEWKSSGPIAFGPDGLLLLADTKGAAIIAVETGDRKGEAAPVKVENVAEKAAALLGTTADKVVINDVAVNPASGRVYLSIARGKGPDAAPALISVGKDGSLALVSLEDVPFARATLPNAPAANPRSPASEVITDLAFIDGRVYVAGLSNEEFSSRLLAIPFPFSESASGTSVEIYHGAHGRFETKSPVRTFTSYKIKGEPYLLAAYTCTPLVKIPLSELKAGSHLKGTTVAELGNRNRPLDMITYEKGGKDYLLLANSSRGVMKIPTGGVGEAEGIVKPVKDTQGISYETITGLKGVMQLDKLDATHAVILIQTPEGAQNLETIELP